jgi:hypothetical protein
MTRAFDDRQIRHYLLGDLSDAEESRLEAAYFGDADLLARVELARDDLADDYAAGRLSQSEREKFERRILATEDGRKLVAITRALQQAAAVAPDMPQRARWQIDRQWLSLAAVIPVAIAAFVAWRLVSGPAQPGDGADRTGQRSAQSQAPASNPVPATSPQDPKPTAGGGTPPATPPSVPVITLATLILTPDLERSQGVPPTLLLSSGATHVELIAPRTGLPSGTVRARVESVEGTAIWSGPTKVAEPPAADSRLRVRVPVSALPAGDYFFVVSPTGSPTSADVPRYYFRVRAR